MYGSFFKLILVYECRGYKQMIAPEVLERPLFKDTELRMGF